MNEIDKLIQELCPDGVEYRKLGEVGTFVRGNGIQKKDFTETGVGCIHYGQIYTRFGFYATKTLTFISEEQAQRCPKAKHGDVVIAITSENVEDVCKAVAWLGQKEIAISGHAAIFNSSELNAKYTSYYFQTYSFYLQKKKYAHGTKVIEISPEQVSKIEIPVPPLPIQEKIVEVLDKFTKLEAELEAELEARRKQYEYYREKLLTFNTPPIAKT